jgi:hypothetical protein
MDDNRKSFLRTSIAFLFFFFALVSFFSVTTPVFAGPDDDYHLASIWCADGQNSKMCSDFTNDEYTTYGKIPADLSGLLSCKSRDISVSLNCENHAKFGTASFIRINDGSYPNIFYKFFNLFVFQDSLNSIVIMRLINSFIIFLSICFAIALLPVRSSSKIFQSIFLFLVPFPLFLMGTNNPQSWSVILIIPVYFIFSSILIDSNSQKRKILILQILFLLITFFMIIGSRGDGVYLILFLIVIVCLANLKHLDKSRIVIVGFLIFATFLLNRIFGPRKFSLGVSNMESEGRPFTLHNILELPGFLLGIFGAKGDSGYLSLGSYDLPLPSISWVAIVLSIVLLLSGGYGNKSHKFTFVVGLLGVAFICLYGMNQQLANTSGFFQPRYLLGFVIITLLIGIDKNLHQISKGRYFAALSLTTVGYASFMYAVILRYSSGIRVEASEYLQMFAAPNTYVSKSTIHWEWFSGSVHGLYSLNSAIIFSLMLVLSLGLSISLHAMRRCYLRLDSVSQRNTMFGVNPLSKSN